MGLILSGGSFATCAAHGELWWTLTWPGALYHGPVVFSANFQGAQDNYGTVATVQTNVNSYYDDSHGYYWPMGINSSALLRNDSNNSVIYNVSLGWF
jgi:hypothetical protein